MMLCHVEIKNFRNLGELVLEPGPKFNLVYGNNGSGKTSILEAIYYLSLGRSFRSRLSKTVIGHGQDKFCVFGKTKLASIGVERRCDNALRLKVAGKEVKSVAELARHLRLQLISPEVYQVLTGSPRFRRKFIDWSLFHVEPTFLSLWQSMQRTLKQRNIALKMRVPREEIELWNPAFVKAAKAISAMRKQYLCHFKPILLKTLEKLLVIEQLSIEYFPGWPEDCLLAQLLKDNFHQDLANGYTQYGPHCADMIITINARPAKELLSRGQQKLFIYAMCLAQGKLLNQTLGNCIYLIDDITAELDNYKCQILFDMLAALDSQIFVTNVDAKIIKTLNINGLIKLFHVEQGYLVEV